MTEEQLIIKCLDNDRKAQKELYGRYSNTMFGVCRRYIKSDMDAEDVMIQGFYKVFTKLSQFKREGSFEGWIRRIMVNESLMYLRKFNMNLSIERVKEESSKEASAEDRMAETEILALLDKLPSGYRTVFNLYAIEGYSHKEIAAQLGISVNTSKSQLIKARKKLQSYLGDMENKVA